MANFKKTLDLQILQKGQYFRKGSIKHWLSKWDRTIAAITAIIIFFGLLGFVIVNIIFFDQNEDEISSSSGKSNGKVSTYYYEIQPLNEYLEKCIISDSILVCTSAKSEELVKDINKAIEERPVKKYEELELVKVIFKDNKIDKGWLDGVNLNIASLTITKSQLSELGEKAFSGDVFNNLRTLTLSDTKISTFRRNMFEESQIETLQINYGTMFVVNFEKDAFGALGQALTTLQLQGCLSNNVLLNITGPNTTLKSLSVLDLRNNNLRELQASSFSNVSNLRQLFMSDSLITDIEPNTFAFLYLQKLDLRNNKMTTLPEHMFDSVETGISINGNPWICNCDLVWLRDLYNSKTDLFTDDFLCYTSEGFKYYKNVNFCSDSTTESHRSTFSTTKPTYSTTEITDATTEPTTESPPSTQTVFCHEEHQMRTLDNAQPIDDYTIDVRKGQVVMHFAHTADPYETYILYVTGNISNESLLWKSEDVVECVKSVSGGFQYQLMLKSEKTYTFCILQPSSNTASPFDCTALTTPPPLEKRAWITNNFKIPLILAISGSILAAIFVSGIIVFYCIRQHPNLIKGNKRVIIVESKAADAIIMPKTYYDEINYTPPSLYSYSNGYLTPKYNGINTQIIVPQHLRTIAEHTAFVIPTNNTDGRFRKGHYRRRTRVEHVTQSFDDHVYESPPPLPPNHPSEMKNFDCISLNSSRV
ncbi:uncharacterized protein LOC123005307 [Tribolium madens]|uniref:uncharacterized protein LOC123005307 n=1 Tax=Tribolium madens TaxID=41895 RepID=UPI001CF71D33|nr:uncharacterized protein LOC123005307 [Tribolium madens]